MSNVKLDSRTRFFRSILSESVIRNYHQVFSVKLKKGHNDSLEKITFYSSYQYHCAHLQEPQFPHPNPRPL